MNLFPSQFTKPCDEILPRGKNALYRVRFLYWVRCVWLIMP